MLGLFQADVEQFVAEGEMTVAFEFAPRSMIRGNVKVVLERIVTSGIRLSNWPTESSFTPAGWIGRTSPLLVK